VWQELCALNKVKRYLGAGLSTVVNPNVIISCLACNTLSVWLCNACSLARHWQTHFPGRLTCLMPLLYTQVQYHCVYWRELCREASFEINIWLASDLVRVPNSRSGGQEFVSPVWQEPGALTKVENPWGQVFLQQYTCVLRESIFLFS
jgi:hypothetical protein